MGGMCLLSRCEGVGGSLYLTPWHPVRVRNTWRFPCDVHLPQLRPCMAIYNLVLDSQHVAVLNGVECVTLGHGFTGPVVEHAFYGTEAVLDALRGCSGWDQGFIRIGSKAPYNASRKLCFNSNMPRTVV